MSATRKTADKRFAEPNEDDARTIRAVLDVLRLFREEAPTVPVSYAMAFLQVALKPGGGSTDYMGSLDTIQPNMSRILLSLANRERGKVYGESGYGLLDFAPDPLDLRRNRTYLTPKGRALLHNVLTAVNRVKH